MPYFRVSLRGSVTSGEVWSVNPCFATDGFTTDWIQASGDAAVAAIRALTIPASLKQLISTAAPITSLRLELRQDNGELMGASEATWPAIAGGTAPTKSPQDSVVISLRSNTPGGSGRGRIYWPALGATLDATTLRIASPVIGTVATESATFLRGIQDAIKNGYFPPLSAATVELCVVSQKNLNHVKVVRLEVGNVLDTQRRRRDAMREAYSTASFPA